MGKKKHIYVKIYNEEEYGGIYHSENQILLRKSKNKTDLYFLNKYVNLMNGEEGKISFANFWNMRHFKETAKKKATEKLQQQTKVLYLAIFTYR
jgi:hypothetical protein